MFFKPWAIKRCSSNTNNSSFNIFFCLDIDGNQPQSVNHDWKCAGYEISELDEL